MRHAGRRVMAELLCPLWHARIRNLIDAGDDPIDGRERLPCAAVTPSPR
jgi:hypothetical protein